MAIELDLLSVVFRVDASPIMGSGHFMRCLTLAEELKKNNCIVRFISRALPLHFEKLLLSKGIELGKLAEKSEDITTNSLDCSHWLRVTQEEDAAETLQLLLDKKWDWIIIDHYSIDDQWESKFRKIARKVMVIDDLANRNHDCDILLDQNFYLNMNERYIGKVSLFCQQLIGPKYALLRPQFAEERAKLRKRNGEIGRLLIFFGGGDSQNYTEKAISVVSEIKDIKFHVDVVIGNSHPEIDKILAICKKLNYSCHVQTDQMASLIANADLAIGAGGSATWERCALGLPTFAIAIADNQKEILDAASKVNIVYSPDVRNNIKESMSKYLTDFIGNKKRLISLANNGMSYVDAMGVERVVNEMREH